MKVLVLGSGLMGPAAVYNAMTDPDVARVLLCDRDPGQLDAAVRRFAGLEEGAKLAAEVLDLNDRPAAVRKMEGYDVVIAALPRPVNGLAIQAALEAGVPLVDLTRPDSQAMPELKRAAEGTGGLVIMGCGVEPGLTEIMARHLAENLDRVDELHIKCGGIPEKPAPPLGYKIVFGGRQLPLREGDADYVREGRLVPVPRYSGVERVVFPGVGECEAWHEGFVASQLELPVLKNLRLGTQKTIRWPGYADKVNVLKEMGLLSQEPVMVEGVPVVPKKVLDAVLNPRVRLGAGERDLTLFRVEVAGEKDGRLHGYKAEMVDRYDERLNLTSMARTTSFTGAIVARMIARGDLRAIGVLPPEQVVTGPLFDRLLEELAAVGVRFEITGGVLEAEGGSARG
jgi:lysine 6-dehydrogenase